MAKKKVDANEPDEFLEALRSGYKYVLENIKFVSMIAGGILAGFLIILLVLYQIKSSRIREAAALDTAVAAFHEGRMDDALKALDGLSGKGDLAEARAEMYSGNIFYDQSKYEEAVKHYQTALKIARDKKIEVVQDLALQGIAYAELALGDFDKAEAAFKDVGDQFRDLTQLELARIYADQGKVEKAKKSLDDLFTNYADSPWVAEAKQLKGQLAKK